MNGLKSGLLGTAALILISQAASADELSALKAEIEALNGRISQLEAAPSVPEGYQLLTITETDASPFTGEKASDFVGRDRKATVIGILPTADMPATTTIEWHGQIRTALTYAEGEEAVATHVSSFGSPISVVDTGENVDVNVRGRLWVRATTDTAVGEIGVQIRLESDVGIADAGEEVNMDIAWGWWQMTPNWQAAAGYAASLAAVPHGMDEQTTFGATGGVTNRDVDQRRLTYSNGPLSITISSEESEANNTGNAFTTITTSSFGNSANDRGDMPATAVRVSYAGDSFSASVSGIWQDDDGFTVTGTTRGTHAHNSSATAAGDDDWFVGGGVTYSGDMFLLSAAAGVGEGYAGAYNGAEAPANDDSYWGGSVFARVNVSDASFIELGYGYSELDWLETFSQTNTSWSSTDVTTHTVNAGLYYAPVSQLTIGLQGDYRAVEYDSGSNHTYDFFTASFITWFSF